MSGFSKYDLWKTREPPEPYYEPEIVYQVTGCSPHSLTSPIIGEYPTRELADAAGQRWLSAIAKAIADSHDCIDDYCYEVAEVDLLADCICTNRPHRWCPVHGQDPDDARDQKLDR